MTKNAIYEAWCNKMFAMTEGMTEVEIPEELPSMTLYGVLGDSDNYGTPYVGIAGNFLYVTDGTEAVAYELDKDIDEQLNELDKLAAQYEEAEEE